MNTKRASARLDFRAQFTSLSRALCNERMRSAQERNGYENILKSYEGEVTVAVVTATRLEQQQSQLEEYRRMCEELERRLEQRQQPAQQAVGHPKF